MNIKQYIKKALRPLFLLTWKNNSFTKMKGPHELVGKYWLRNKAHGSAYWNGTYESDVYKQLKSLFTQDTVFFDIGAHAGYFSMLAAEIAKKGMVYSFEPVPNNHYVVDQNCKKNKYTNWKAEQLALSDTTGTLEFDLGMSSSRGAISSTKTEHTQTVQVTTIDNYIKKNTITSMPTVMKIDVEGYAGEVLAGAKSLLSITSPHIILELHSRNNEVEKCEKILGDNYDYFTFSGEQLAKPLKEEYHILYCKPKS